MFNNDLLYIRNNMSGAPALSFANEVEMLKSLKTLFAGVEIDYTLIDGQKIIRNQGISFDKTTILLLTDGYNKIYSRVQVINNNECIILEDISLLVLEDIKIYYPSVNYDIDVENKTLSNKFGKLTFKSTQHSGVSVTAKMLNGNIAAELSIDFVYNSGRPQYEIVYNDALIFIKTYQNGSYTPLIFAIQENVILCKKTKTPLVPDNLNNLPWVGLTRIGKVEQHYSGSFNILDNAPMALYNYVILGERVDFICNHSGGSPKLVDRQIYSNVIDNKNIFIFSSSSAYDKGVYWMWGKVL